MLSLNYMTTATLKGSRSEADPEGVARGRMKAPGADVERRRREDRGAEGGGV